MAWMVQANSKRNIASKYNMYNHIENKASEPTLRLQPLLAVGVVLKIVVICKTMMSRLLHVIGKQITESRHN